jgi:ferredoxin
LREDAGGKIAETARRHDTMILIGCEGASCACTGMAAKSLRTARR